MDTIATMERAMQQLSAGDLSAAQSSCNDVLRDESDNPDAMYVLGVVALRRGDLPEAARLLKQAIAIEPNAYWYHSTLAEVRALSGDADGAIDSLRRAIAVDADQFPLYESLANLLSRRGQLDEVADLWRDLSTRHANDPAAFHKLGGVLIAQHRSREAINVFNQLLKLEPDSSAAHSGIAICLADVRQADEAVEHAKKAIALAPDDANAYYALGIVHAAAKQNDLAVDAYEKAVELKPGFVEARRRAALLHASMGELDRAMTHWREIVQLAPDDTASQHALLLNLNYFPGISPQAIFDAHKSWAIKHSDPVLEKVRPHKNTRDPGRRLRIGLACGEFRYHAVAMFLKPLFEHSDTSQFETICFTPQAHEDDMTRDFRRRADGWHSVRGLSPEQVAEHIRAQEIDILIDLNGHSGATLLQAAARKPAPVQMTYLGYCNTTGMSAMDYIFGDEITDPPATTQPYVEKLIRLPGCFSCYSPLPESPPVNALPALLNGCITLGSYNMLKKLNPPVFDLWSQLLNELPNAKLLILRDNLTERERARIIGEFTQRGVQADRVDVPIEPAPKDRMKLSVYHRFDIALDAFPWSGHTSSCNAMWMGVPFVTLRGHNHAGRMAASTVTHAGFGKFVADSTADFVRIVKSLAADISKLSELRQSMRGAMSGSDLCNVDQFKAGWENALRSAWREWCSVG